MYTICIRYKYNAYKAICIGYYRFDTRVCKLFHIKKINK